MACIVASFGFALYVHVFLLCLLLQVPSVRRVMDTLREHFHDFILLVAFWPGDFFRGCILVCLWRLDIHCTVPFHCEGWSMLAYVLATTTSQSTCLSIYCFAMLGFLFPAFPRKTPEPCPKKRNKLKMVYRGETHHLQPIPTAAAAKLRGTEAIQFLSCVPEVAQGTWSMAQFDGVWKALNLYVREGAPKRQADVDISMIYKGILLKREGQSKIPHFFWKVELERFNSLPVITEETVTVECAKTAFQKLSGISDRKHIVPLAIGLSCLLPGTCCLEKDVSERVNGKCWDCFVKYPAMTEGRTYQCQVCALAISETSDANFKSKCWSCFLLHPGDESSGARSFVVKAASNVPVPALPCKNLTAAHIACPNTRIAIGSGLYCESCRTTIQPTGKRFCRNAAICYLIKGSEGSHMGCPELGQSNKYGFANLVLDRQHCLCVSTTPTPGFDVVML